MDLRLYPLHEDDFNQVIELGALVYGKNYLRYETLCEIYGMSFNGGLCCSYVMYDDPREKDKLVGFRLTYAPGAWVPDKWCSMEDWGVAQDKVCYFKSNTVHPGYQGKGIGPVLLEASINSVKQMGALAGITHIWLESPGRRAYRYFSKTGARLLWVWPERWGDDLEKEGYSCKICCTAGQALPCKCSAAEMLLYFEGTN